MNGNNSSNKNNNEAIKLQLLGMLSGQSASGTPRNDISGIVSRLSPDEQRRLADILNNPEKQREILNSPLAKKLIKNYKNN